MLLESLEVGIENHVEKVTVVDGGGALSTSQAQIARLYTEYLYMGLTRQGIEAGISFSKPDSFEKTAVHNLKTGVQL